MTLEEAKKVLRDNWKAGTECPCCTQFVKLYKRKLNSGMANVLIRSYKEIQRTGEEWLHIISFLREIKFASGHDWTLLQQWGLLEEKPTNPGEPSSGYWKVTPRGESFVKGLALVPTHLSIFNSKVYGVSEEKTDIVGALGRKFSYQELMFGK